MKLFLLVSALLFAAVLAMAVKVLAVPGWKFRTGHVHDLEKMTNKTKPNINQQKVK